MHLTTTCIGLLAIIGLSHVFAFELQHCFETNPEDAYLLMQCDQDHMVNITTIIHGVSKIRNCDVTMTFDLCREKVTWTDCAGQQTCAYAIGHSYSVKCGGYLTFVQVKYSCLPVPRTTVTTTSVTTTPSPIIYVNTEQTTNLLHNQETTDRSRTDIATSTPSIDSDAVPVGAIAGVVVGTVLICAVMLGVAIFCNRRRMNVLQKAEHDQQSGEDGTTHQSTAVQFNEMVQFQSDPHRHDARLTPEGREVIETTDPALNDIVLTESPGSQNSNIHNGAQTAIRTNNEQNPERINVVGLNLDDVQNSGPHRDMASNYAHTPSSHGDRDIPSYAHTTDTQRNIPSMGMPHSNIQRTDYADSPSVRLQSEGSREARDIESDLNYGPDSNV